MRAGFLILLFNLVVTICHTQSNNDRTDKYVTQVNTFLKDNLLTKRVLDQKSSLGGDISGYYFKNKLQLIVSRLSSEFGFIEYSFYLEKDSLLFVNEKKVALKEPASEKEYSEYEKYVLFNTDKNGNTDLKKWPLTTDISNNYYLQNRKIVKYELKNFNKTVKASEGEIEEANKSIVERYLIHQEALKLN